MTDDELRAYIEAAGHGTGILAGQMFEHARRLERVGWSPTHAVDSLGRLLDVGRTTS